MGNYKKFRRGLAFGLVCLLIFTGVGSLATNDNGVAQAEEQTDITASDTDAEKQENGQGNYQYVNDGYTVELILGSTWDTGYNATVNIYNTGDSKIQNWCVAFPIN